MSNDDDLVVLESVNKNVQGANAILCDELIMLVGFDSVWKEELWKYFWEEKRERREVQRWNVQWGWYGESVIVQLAWVLFRLDRAATWIFYADPLVIL